MEQHWIVAGGAGVVLLVALVWFFARRQSNADAETGGADPSPEAEIRLTEPTLEPPPEEPDAAETAETADTADTADTEVSLPEAAGAEDSEALVDAPPKPADEEPQAGDEPDAPEPETSGSEALEPAEEEPESAPEETEAEPEKSASAEAPEPTTDADLGPEPADETPPPEPPAIPDPAFDSARTAFERELLAGRFSRLDVFDAYERVQAGPDDPGIPRSEYFNRVVNAALKARDAYEVLLTDQDRERFVDIHSRYLDDVTGEEDPETRERMHREHAERLDALRAKSPGDASSG